MKYPKSLWSRCVGAAYVACGIPGGLAAMPSAAVAADAPQAVHVVCLAESRAAFFNTEVILAVAKNADLLRGLLEAIRSDDNRAVDRLKNRIEEELDKLVGQVDGFSYLSLGSGVVVDREHRVVLTNHHVASACPFSSDSDNKASRRQLAILEPVTGGFRAIRARERNSVVKKDAGGNVMLDRDSKPREETLLPAAICRSRELKCDAVAAMGTPRPSASFKAAIAELQSRNNILHWAPDLMFLDLGQPSSVPPVTFGSSASLQRGAGLAFSGFPGVAQQGRESTGGPGSRELKVTPVTLPATFSQVFVSDNTANTVGVEQVVATRLVELSGASALPGNSGGPLYDPATGQVLGLIESTMQSQDAPVGLSYAVSTDDIVAYAKRAGVAISVAGAGAPDRMASASAGGSASARASGDDSGASSWLSEYRTAMLAGLAALVTIVIGLFWHFSRRDSASSVDGVKASSHAAGQHGAKSTRPVYLVRLRGTQGALNGKEFLLPNANGQRVLVVGRNPAECQIVFPETAEDVGKRHCRFEVDEASRTLFVEDLRSTNGTFVNRRRLNAGERVQLRSSDAVSLARPDGHMFVVGDV